jgi:hypothetical protein
MAKITHSELATRLIVEGALNAITETVRGRMPIEPVMLSDADAVRLGLPPGGSTLFYPVSGDSGVFFDVTDSRMAAWYSGADADRALALFDKSLRDAHREAKQVADAAHPDDSSMRLRAYDVKLGNGRMATIEVSYSKPGVKPPKFSATVVAMALKN